MTRFFADTTPGGMVLRLVILLGPVLALLATGIGEGPGPRVVLLVLVVLLSAGFAVLPDSPLGAAATGVVVIWWALAARDDLPPAAILAAWLLLAAHLASVVVAYGPRELPVDPALLGRWLNRGLLLAVAAPLLWGLGRLVGGQPEPSGMWVVGLLAAIVVCVVAAVAVTTSPSTS